MATENQRHGPVESTDERYSNCLVTPMGRNGDPHIRVEHVIDAALVGLLAFAAVILVDVVPALLAGQPVFLTPEQILARVPTAVMAFLLTFVAMWARARGLDVLALVHRLTGGN